MRRALLPQTKSNKNLAAPMEMLLNPQKTFSRPPKLLENIQKTITSPPWRHVYKFWHRKRTIGGAPPPLL